MPDAGVKTGVVSARPTFAVDGEVRENLREDLLAMRVEETTDGLYDCEATFANWGPVGRNEMGFVHFDRDTFDFGTELTIDAFAGSERKTVFEGRVTALESQVPGTEAPSLVVLAEDRLQDLRMTRRTRTFEDVSDKDVARQIARDHSLQTDVDVDGPTHNVLAQVNQSDLAFLRDRARAIDAEVWIEGKTLRMQERSRRDAGDLTLTYGEGLRSVNVRADLAHQQTDFTVSGWDVQAKESIEETADKGVLQGELNGGRSGADTLKEALGGRTQQMVHTTPLTTDEARAIAKASFRQHARRFVEARGVAEGDGRLRVGAQVKLVGVGERFEGGRYTLTEVRHTFNPEDGYRTHFTAQRPYLGQ
ncbi:MAG: contractile injection system protein, VgrG/Pvc8 family [Salinibacter sp.]|uniref:phage late control D family protein n=1 Tax=Salinibacter sp. TaxID=2065818 RepID=UPI002FC38464